MDIIKVSYPAKVKYTHSLPGMKATRKADFIVVKDCVGHLQYHEQYLCKQSAAEILRETKADKMIDYPRALQGHNICEECEKAYKTRSGFPWDKWVHGNSALRNAEDK